MDDLPFFNRIRELKALDHLKKSGGLIVFFGRRRVGKTRLIKHFLKKSKGLYSQAIESTVDLQIEQISFDLKELLPAEIRPKNWIEFFELLNVAKGPPILAIDEFPYLVASDSSLPSIVQRWIDHKMPRNFSLILSGSSQQMMHGIFLQDSSPLYQRSKAQIHLLPMKYQDFCNALNLDGFDPDNFVKFSLVGGIPHYWQICSFKRSIVNIADDLYFSISSFFERELDRILTDEGLAGILPRSVLEAIGRGSQRSSEIAARLNTAPTNLSRVFQLLIDASLISRDLPFGESARTTKRTLYRIIDPALKCWFSVYSPHRSRWAHYSQAEKKQLLNVHAANVFEDKLREIFPNGQRYWESDAEYDYVTLDPKDLKKVILYEFKWRNLKASEQPAITARITSSFTHTNLAKRYVISKVKIIDREDGLKLFMRYKG